MADFASLFGQTTAIRALRRALASDCLPGTYLFVGPTGVGKGALARAFAQAATCLTPRTDPFDACNVCESCRLMQAGTHPDVVTVLPAGDQMQIWQFWERDNKPGSGLLSRTLSYAPSVGGRRLYILEGADTLTESAANSLLKVLEEPPPYAIFILLAPHSARVLPTIVSRSQMIRLQPVPVAELARYLQTAHGVESQHAMTLAAYAEGRIGQAVQMAQNPLVGEEIARVLDFAESLPTAPRARALKAAEQMRKLAGQMKALVGEEPVAAASETGEGGGTAKERAGRRQLAAVFDLLTAFYHDLLALRVGGQAASGIVNAERAATFARLAQTSGPERWTRCLDALILARRRLDANANTTLVTEVLAMTLLEPSRRVEKPV